MPKKFSAPPGSTTPPPKPTGASPRIPEEVAGFQVNFCKSPLCPNFGRPAHATRVRRPKGTTPLPGDYTIAGMGKSNPGLKCDFCGEIAPLRSNLAIAEEAYRLAGDLLKAPTEPSCHNPSCRLHGVPASGAGGQYVSFGKTAAGTPRYRCNTCGKTFSGAAKPIARQRRSEKNRDVFLLIMNKAPISRMQETTGLHPKALYDKIDFIHRQACAFAASRERRLGTEAFNLPKMYIAVDRQHYVVNWSQRTDRRTVQLNAMASADVGSGYVFGFHLNFDPLVDSAAVIRDADDTGDAVRDPPFRKYARVWLPEDYREAQADAAKRDAVKRDVGAKGPTFKEGLLNDIELTYVDALVRSDIEESDHKDSSVKLPARGMQVHEQYTMYAHFMLLAKLLRNAPKVRLFMDQDSGFRAAFMAAFAGRIRDREAEGFFVKVGKEATAYQKQNAVATAKVRVAQVAADYGWTLDRALLEMMKAEIDGAVPLGKWKDKWVMHPMPIAAEPFKRVCWLTDMGDYDADHAARLYLKATLHPVDRFFMQTRRRLSMAERPVVSVRKQRMMWHGYGAYNPGTLAKFLETYRTYYNYCLAGKDKKTPAMRLGLAQALIDPQDIIYWNG